MIKNNIEFFEQLNLKELFNPSEAIIYFYNLCGFPFPEVQTENQTFVALLTESVTENLKHDELQVAEFTADLLRTEKENTNNAWDMLYNFLEIEDPIDDLVENIKNK